MNRAVIPLILACTASAFASDNQQVYKWTDANGVLHFSDAPPPSDTKNVQSLHLVGGTTTTPEGTAPSDTGKPATPATPGAVADAADARAKDCEQARRNLKMLQSDLPVSEVDANGKVKPIDDKEREARIAGVMDRIAQACAN